MRPHFELKIVKYNLLSRIFLYTIFPLQELSNGRKSERSIIFLYSIIISRMCKIVCMARTPKWFSDKAVLDKHQKYLLHFDPYPTRVG